MKIEIRPRTELYNDKFYIARNGSEFTNELACIEYEESLDAEDMLKKLPYRAVYYGEYSEWYYVSSEEDYNILANYIKLCGCGDRTEIKPFSPEFINQWMSYDIVGYNDYPSSCYMITFKEIKKEYDELVEKLFN